MLLSLKFFALVQMMLCHWASASESCRDAQPSNTAAASLMQSRTDSQNAVSIERYVKAILADGQSIVTACKFVKLYVSRFFFFQSCSIAFCCALLNHQSLMSHYSPAIIQDLLRRSFVEEMVKLSEEMKQCVKEVGGAALLKADDFDDAVRDYAENLFESVCVNDIAEKFDDVRSIKVSFNKRIFPIILAAFSRGEKVDLMHILELNDIFQPKACNLSLINVFEEETFLPKSMNLVYEGDMEVINSELRYAKLLKAASDTMYSVTHISRKNRKVMFSLIKMTNYSKHDLLSVDGILHELTVGTRADFNDLRNNTSTCSDNLENSFGQHNFGVDIKYVQEGGDLLDASVSAGKALDMESYIYSNLIG